MRRGISEGNALARSPVFRPVIDLVPLLLGSVVVALLAMAAAPASGEWFFQSPVSPLRPIPTSTLSVPQPTVTGPALVSVPATANFLPWILGVLVVGGIVAAALFWRRDKGERGEDA
ncbi:MAG TPA: hypothetical protein ENO24_08310 [Chloroflexi bacterium]|nr:hypothetical protein [Chloroflexota bacterium]